MRSCFLFVISIVGCCLSGCAWEVSDALFPCTKKLDNPYGVCAHLTQTFWDYPMQQEMLGVMNNANIGNVRYDLWIPYSEKLSGHRHLQLISNTVRNCNSANLGQLGILFVGWKEQRAWQKKAEYEAFLDTLISAHKDDIQCWEVMNEVNQAGVTDKLTNETLVSRYMELLPLTYKKLKDANAKVIVTSSGFNEVRDGFIEEMCRQRCYEYFDVLNFHSYDLPEKFPEKFEKIKGLMDEYGWRKPVWITECGMSTYQDTIYRPWRVPNEQKEMEQAHRIPRMYIIAFAYGVDKVFTYSLRSREKNKNESEDHFGILHADLSPKPAYFAYKTMTEMMPTGSLRPTLTKSGNTYVGYWKRPDGKKVWALWNSKGDKKISLDMKGKGKFYDVMGKKLSMSKELTIGKGVIYVVGAKDLRIGP